MLTVCELGERTAEKCDSVSSSWKVLLLLLNAERCSWNIIWTHLSVLPGIKSGPLLAGKLLQLSLVSTVLEIQQKARGAKLTFLAVLYGVVLYEIFF